VRKLPVPSNESPKKKSPKKKSPKKNSPQKKSSPRKRKLKEWELDDSEEEEVEELSKGDEESSKEKVISDDEESSTEKDISDDEEIFKEKEVSDDDVSVGKLPANTQAKKRRTIDEDMDADDDEILPNNFEDDKFVEFVERKDPAKIIPLLEQELVLPSDEVRNRKKPTPYQQIQQCQNVHKTAPKKKTDRVPTIKPNALKNKEWHKIENSLEITQCGLIHQKSMGQSTLICLKHSLRKNTT
jgi:hypothetical protein